MMTCSFAFVAKNMKDQFKIYIEQLRDGRKEKVDETFSPEFLDVHEEDLNFVDPVRVKGEVYLADDALILHFDICAIATIPCSICNESVKSEVAIDSFYHMVPLSEVKSGTYYFDQLLRDTILLETPSFAECHQGHCPKREEFKMYFKDPTKKQGSDEEGYHPFNDLHLDT